MTHLVSLDDELVFAIVENARVRVAVMLYSKIIIGLKNQAQKQVRRNHGMCSGMQC